MKIFKHRNLMGTLFCVMLSLPFLSVVARTGYTIVNKNAYQSYNNKVTRTINITDNTTSLIQTGQTYMYNGMKQPLPNGTGWSNGWYFIGNNISTSLKSFFNKTFDIDGFGFSADGNYLSYYRMYFHDKVLDTWVYDTQLRYYNDTFSKNMLNLTFTFDLVEGTDFYLSGNISKMYLTTDSLDNAFEYSMNKVIDNNNFGKINFTQWLFDLVLDNNQQNNLYVHFFNWYMNYTVFVSGTYILFLCLMWFINFSRRLLERGMNYDF